MKNDIKYTLKKLIEKNKENMSKKLISWFQNYYVRYLVEILLKCSAILLQNKRKLYTLDQNSVLFYTFSREFVFDILIIKSKAINLVKVLITFNFFDNLDPYGNSCSVCMQDFCLTL